MTGGALSLALALEFEPGARAAGAAVVSNDGDAPVRIWRQGSTWGDGTLSFVLARGAATETIVRRAQDYTRNVPATIEVAARDAVRVAFDLADGTWERDDAIAAIGEGGTRLAAVLEIAPTPESSEHGVWTGRVQSDFVAPG